MLFNSSVFLLFATVFFAGWFGLRAQGRRLTWGDVDRETQAFGLATPGGLISDTGLAGLTTALDKAAKAATRSSSSCTKAGEHRPNKSSRSSESFMN